MVKSSGDIPIRRWSVLQIKEIGDQGGRHLIAVFESYALDNGRNSWIVNMYCVTETGFGAD